MSVSSKIVTASVGYRVLPFLQVSARAGLSFGGLEEMIESIRQRLPDNETERSRQQAVALVAAMVGALILSRAVPDETALADELLEATLSSALQGLRP